VHLRRKQQVKVSNKCVTLCCTYSWK